MDAGALAKLLESRLGDFTDESLKNRISAEAALEPQAIGMHMFDCPLVAYGDAGDELFTELLRPEVLGPQMRLPEEWVEGARSVISYFFPMSGQVRLSNRGTGRASIEWFHARIDGQAFILEAGRYLVSILEGLGYQAVCPAADARFAATFLSVEDRAQSFRSNWSERHVAYVCGLGTFSLSKGLITEAGTAGRFGSVVTTAALPPTVRLYDDLYEYCIMCGMCAERCPVNAISIETGKDHFACYDELMASKAFYPGYYGCGKCQVDVPCEFRRPVRAGKRPTSSR